MEAVGDPPPHFEGKIHGLYLKFLKQQVRIMEETDCAAESHKRPEPLFHKMCSGFQVLSFRLCVLLSPSVSHRTVKLVQIGRRSIKPQ